MPQYFLNIGLQDMALPSNFKEACRLRYQVKGTMMPKDATFEECKYIIDSYTKRVWYNEEGYIYTENFEEDYYKYIVQDQ